MPVVRMLQRWNYSTHQYEDHEVSADWKVTTDADEYDVINCASCGTALKPDDSYTSMTIHTPVGIGYLICDKCLGIEQLLKKESQTPFVKQLQNRLINQQEQKRRQQRTTNLAIALGIVVVIAIAGITVGRALL